MGAVRNTRPGDEEHEGYEGQSHEGQEVTKTLKCVARSFQWVLCATRGQVMKSKKANPMKARKSPNPKSKAKVRKAVVKQAKTSGVFQRSWKKISDSADKPMPPFAVWNGTRLRCYDLKLPTTEPLDLTCVMA